MMGKYEQLSASIVRRRVQAMRNGESDMLDFTSAELDLILSALAAGTNPQLENRTENPA